MNRINQTLWLILASLSAFILSSCDQSTKGEKIIIGTWAGRSATEDVELSSYLEEDVDVEAEMVFDFFSDNTGIFRFSFQIDSEVNDQFLRLVLGGYNNGQEYSSSLTWRYENGAVHAVIEEDHKELFGGPHIKYELMGDSALVHKNWFSLKKVR